MTLRSAYQPPANGTFLSEQTRHQQSASSIFLSEQISTSHQPPAKRTGLATIKRGTTLVINAGPKQLESLPENHAPANYSEPATRAQVLLVGANCPSQSQTPIPSKTSSATVAT
jgi:hypothetical protein